MFLWFFYSVSNAWFSYFLALCVCWSQVCCAVKLAEKRLLAGDPFPTAPPCLLGLPPRPPPLSWDGPSCSILLLTAGEKNWKTRTREESLNLGANQCMVWWNSCYYNLNSLEVANFLTVSFSSNFFVVVDVVAADHFSHSSVTAHHYWTLQAGSRKWSVHFSKVERIYSRPYWWKSCLPFLG